MSGSNYAVPATITTAINIEINCDICTQLIANQIRGIEGVESMRRTGRQLVVVQRIHQDKLRANETFSKPQKITAVMGINVDCYGCAASTKKIISSDPGFNNMNIDMEKRFVTVKGTLAINDVARKLERKTGRFVKIISMNVEYDASGIIGPRRYGCSDPKCAISWKFDELLKIVNDIVK